MKVSLRLAAAMMATPLLSFTLAKPVAGHTQAPSSDYASLVSLYGEFWAFVPPSMQKGVPDYSPGAMAKHYSRLKEFQARLKQIDDSDWPIAERVDYMVVLAEMRGLEFQHRIVQPWKRDPAFYSTTNLGFGPKMHGAIAIPKLPISRTEAAAFKAKLQAIPTALKHARTNLTEPRGDLARLAIAQKQVELNVYGELATRAAKVQPELTDHVRRAQAAAAEFKGWLEGIEAGLPTHGGVGKENYAWYLKNILLLPYTTDEIAVIGEREYQRQIAFLKIEEHRNRDIAMLEPVKSRAAFDAKRKAEDNDLLEFLRRGKWVTIPEYVRHDPKEGPYQFPFEKDPSKPGLFDPPMNLHFFSGRISGWASAARAQFAWSRFRRATSFTRYASDPGRAASLLC